MFRKVIHGLIILIAVTPFITLLMEKSYIVAGIYIVFFLNTLNPIITRTMVKSDTNTFFFE